MAMLTIAAAGPETTIVFILVTISDQIADSVPETSLTKHKSARIREFKPNRSTHSIPCKCACAAWVPVRATQRPAPQGWPRGDGDGPLADGRAPGECRAHRAPPERRQRHAARVEPVGRGGPNGGGVALRPPFTPRRSTQSSPRWGPFLLQGGEFERFGNH